MRACQLALAATLLLAAGCRILRQHEGPTAGVGDSTISAHVEMALISNPRIEAREIGVHTDQGKVTLDGVVDTAAMARRAEQITRETPGVIAVDSQLQVVGTMPQSGGPRQ